MKLLYLGEKLFYNLNVWRFHWLSDQLINLQP
jgi:hypothetical protein